MLCDVHVDHAVRLLGRLAYELASQIIVDLELLLDLCSVLRVHWHVDFLFQRRWSGVELVLEGCLVVVEH